MNGSSFDFEEFIKPKVEEKETVEEIAEESSEEEVAVEMGVEEEIDVQKAVVESLAADKAELDCEIAALKEQIREKDELLATKEAELAKANELLVEKEAAISGLNMTLAEKERALAENFEKTFETMSRNPNALALLDRDVELPDRFPGETRDHVLEVIKEARDKAESEGRIRRAQVLESVLVNNDFNGNLSTRRSELEKLFIDNGNVINGKVLEELIKLGISHKNGEEYLLTSEILKRNY